MCSEYEPKSILFAFWEHHPIQFLTLSLIMVLTQSNLRKKHTFYKCGLISGPRRSPGIPCELSWRNTWDTSQGLWTLIKSTKTKGVDSGQTESTNAKLAISPAPGRFQNWEFDTMLLSMLPRASHTKEIKDNKMHEFWVEGVPRGAICIPYTPFKGSYIQGSL